MKRILLLLGIIMVAALVACAPGPEPVPTAAVAAEDTSAGVNIVVGNDETTDVELADDVSFTVDADASTLTWQAERIVGNSHEGTIMIKSGSLERADGEFIGGNFVIDMNTIDYPNDRLIGHLKSDDFFSVEMHPEASFALTSMEPLGDNAYRVTGDLTIKGITNEITFDATELTQDETLVMESSFAIDRTQWDIVYDSGTVFSSLGDGAIRDEINFELNLVLN